MHILANLATDTSAVKNVLLKNPAPPPALNCFRSPWRKMMMIWLKHRAKDVVSPVVDRNVIVPIRFSILALFPN